VLALVAEMLGHGHAGVGRDPLQPGGRGRAGHHDDAAFERPLRAQGVDGAAHAGGLLPHGDVDADHVAVALRDQGVDRQRRLAGRMVADDQLALPPAQREQRVHHHDPGLHRLRHQIALDDRRRRAFDRQARVGIDRPLAVQRPAQRIDDPPQQRLAHRHGDDLAGAKDGIARLDVAGRVQHHAADAVRVQHPGKADLAATEAQHLVQPHVAQARDHRHAVADLLDPAAVLGARPQRRPAQRLAGGGGPVAGVRRHRAPPCGPARGPPAKSCAGRNAGCAVRCRRSAPGR